MCGLDSYDILRPGPQSPPHMGLTAVNLQQAIVALPDNLLIPYHKHIACSKKICATLVAKDHSPEIGMLGANVKKMATALVNHGCKQCGHVPFGWPHNNDDSFGFFRLNWETKPCQVTGADPVWRPFGLCPEFELIVAEAGNIEKRDNGTQTPVDTRLLSPGRLEKEERRRIIAAEKETVNQTVLTVE